MSMLLLLTHLETSGNYFMPESINMQIVSRSFQAMKRDLRKIIAVDIYIR